MLHLDTAIKANEITPLCGQHNKDDRFIYVDVEDSQDLRESAEFTDCLKCKQLALEKSAILIKPQPKSNGAYNGIEI